MTPVRFRHHALCIAGLAVSLAGCMHQAEHTEVSRQPIGMRLDPPLKGVRRIRVLAEPAPAGLTVWVFTHRLCRVVAVENVERERVTESTANDWRWAGAAPLAALSVLVGVASNGSDAGLAFATIFGGSAAAIVFVPQAVQGEKRETLPPYVAERRLPELLPCDAHPLSDVRVTLRTPGKTLEAVTDDGGRALLSGSDTSSGFVLFVDDVAISDVVWTNPSSAPSM